jgi:hypothetical protein
MWLLFQNIGAARALRNAAVMILLNPVFTLFLMFVLSGIFTAPCW